MPPATSPSPRIPRCTYRVQLHAGFTFDDLAALVPYLHALGVSDVYCSPIFRPTPGSLHGYDVCDYRVINPELGGDAALHRLADRLRAHGMGLLLDFVPNHMGIDGPFNRWWRDVLEHGLNSAYAEFFDILWNDRSDPGRSRVFAPLLPEHYGVLLEQGKLRLVHEDGELALVHEQTRFPLRPETYADILREIAPDEASANEDVAPADPVFWKRRLNDILACSADTRAALEACLRRLNGEPGRPESFDELDRLIDRQHYRLARWQAGAHGTNYRRFFTIDTLIGLRMEDPRVFEQSHARLGELIRDGVVTGVPDIYQGNEAWDFSLVDPDNRRPVDHEALQARLAALEHASAAELFSRWETGDIKLALTQRVLNLRREHPSLFAEGDYTPVEVEGPLARHVIGFRRRHGDEHLLVLVTRLVSRFDAPPIGEIWNDTHARIATPPAAWRNVITGATLEAHDGRFALAEVFSEIPVAVLHTADAK